MSALAWGVVFGLGMVGILRAMLFMVVVDFVLVGSLVATLTWFITNRFLCQQGKMMTQDSQVEWAYAFDIHCNSFFPLFLILYIVQFFFLPVLIKSNLVCLVAANILYLVSVAWYCYGTFLGFNGKIREKSKKKKITISNGNFFLRIVLPFLVHTELLLYPIIGFVVGFVLLSVFRVNLCENVIGFYFGWS